MKIKTEDLTGAALDYAVAVALGLKIRSQKRDEVGRPGFYAVGDAYNYIWRDYVGRSPGNMYWWCPSQCWRDGGPLIGKFVEWVEEQAPNEWSARSAGEYGYGQTPLIAICRAVVACKLGEEVEVPEELGGAA